MVSCSEEGTVWNARSHSSSDRYTCLSVAVPARTDFEPPFVRGLRSLFPAGRERTPQRTHHQRQPARRFLKQQSKVDNPYSVFFCHHHLPPSLQDTLTEGKGGVGEWTRKYFIINGGKLTFHASHSSTLVVQGAFKLPHTCQVGMGMGMGMGMGREDQE